MATGAEIWEAAKSAVRDEVRRIRPGQRVWTTITPEELGASADSWIIWSGNMIDNFNSSAVKIVAIAQATRRGFRKKPLIDFARALRDA